MNTPVKTNSFFRRFVRWTLISIGICVLPLIALAVVGASCLTLNRDASVLRKEVMAATGSEWKREVQVSVGRGIIGSAALGLFFAPDEHVDDARIALKSVNHASVGVYKRVSAEGILSRKDLFVKTDRAMERRGWTRMVGVVDGRESVLIYTSKDAQEADEFALCLAVVSDDELVVVSTSVNGATLAELVERHSGEFGSKRMRLAGLRF